MGVLKIGIAFPQTEIGIDPVAIRDFAQAVEGLGYDHLVVWDHVFGVNPAGHPGEWLYTYQDMFHEPFVLIGYLAGHTERIGFATAVLILPQRQTALVAKQAAEADVLTGGRLRLGVGVGWNSVEYEALGMDFQTRGARIEEQVRVLRALWTQKSVAFHGQWHHIEEAGINPLPVQRPIPIWMGGDADIVLRRIARLADGWFARLGPPSERHRDQLDRLHGYIVEAGRDPKTVGLEVQLHLSRTGLDECRDAVDAWKALGATHLFLSTLGIGLETPDRHIQMIRRLRDLL